MKILLVLITFLFTSFLYGQENRISMMNDRFSFLFPDSAKNETKNFNIFADEDIETIVVFTKGSKRVVFGALELHSKSIENFEKKLRLDLKDVYTIEILKKNDLDSTICYRLTPIKYDDKEEAILVSLLLIKNADNTLSSLRVVLNPEAFKVKSTFDKMINKVLLSYKKGNRNLNYSARTESFTMLGTNTQCKIKLPEGYILTAVNKNVYRGEDEETYTIKKISDYGETTFGELNVYFGKYPRLRSRELNLEKQKIRDTDGEYMLQQKIWTNYYDKNRNLYLREQTFTEEKIKKETVVYTSMLSNSKIVIEELSDIVKYVQLKYEK